MFTYSPSKQDPWAHTHLLIRSCHCWKHRWKASFGTYRVSVVTFDLMSSMGAKTFFSFFFFFVNQGTAKSHSDLTLNDFWLKIGLNFKGNRFATNQQQIEYDDRSSIGSKRSLPPVCVISFKNIFIMSSFSYVIKNMFHKFQLICNRNVDFITNVQCLVTSHPPCRLKTGETGSSQQSQIYL